MIGDDLVLVSVGGEVTEGTAHENGLKGGAQSGVKSHAVPTELLVKCEKRAVSYTHLTLPTKA